MAKIKNFVLTINHSDGDTTEVTPISATRTQAIKFMMRKIKEIMDIDPDSLDYGTDEPEQLDYCEREDRYTGTVVFSDSHSTITLQGITGFKPLTETDAENDGDREDHNYGKSESEELIREHIKETADRFLEIYHVK